MHRYKSVVTCRLASVVAVAVLRNIVVPGFHPDQAVPTLYVGHSTSLVHFIAVFQYFTMFHCTPVTVQHALYSVYCIVYIVCVYTSPLCVVHYINIRRGKCNTNLCVSRLWDPHFGCLFWCINIIYTIRCTPVCKVQFIVIAMRWYNVTV